MNTEYLGTIPAGISWDERQQMGLWKTRDITEASGSGKRFSQTNLYFKNALEHAVRQFSR